MRSGGRHARIGLEDNIYFRGELAPNERFVERMVSACRVRPGSSHADEAWQIMHLKAR
jgi:uncharacterized protein (DUF849 family)